MDFSLPFKLTKVLTGFKKPWYIAGGWAIDLFLDKVTRKHKDIEIAIFRKHQKELYDYLNDWVLYKAIPRQVKLERWKKNEWLSLPIHEIHAFSKNRRLKPINFEILLNESNYQNWLFRRNLNILRPISKVGKVGYYGIPYLSPEIVLLYKAKEFNNLDFNDFVRSLDFLTNEELIWLNASIKECYPSHPWLNFFSF